MEFSVKRIKGFILERIRGYIFRRQNITPLSPRTLLEKVIETAVEEIRMWSADEGVMPNHYSVHISQEDFEIFFGTHLKESCRRAENAIREYAHAINGFTVQEPVRVEICCGSDIRLGQVQIQATFDCIQENLTPVPSYASEPQAHPKAAHAGSAVDRAITTDVYDNDFYTKGTPCMYSSDMTPYIATDSNAQEPQTASLTDIESGKSFDIDRDDAIVGRQGLPNSPIKADIILDDSTDKERYRYLSRHHAHIYSRDGVWMIAKPSEEHDTAYNGISVERDGALLAIGGTEPLVLCEGDLIRLANRIFSFSRKDASMPEAPSFRREVSIPKTPRIVFS